MLPFVAGSFAHGFTYSGHPVACAVAIEALKIYRYAALFVTWHSIPAPIKVIIFCYWRVLCENGISERDIPGHVKQIAPKFQDGIRAFADSPIIGEVRVSISELTNLPRGPLRFWAWIMFHESTNAQSSLRFWDRSAPAQRLLFLIRYMTTVLLCCRYVAWGWYWEPNSPTTNHRLIYSLLNGVSKCSTLYAMEYNRVRPYQSCSKILIEVTILEPKLKLNLLEFWKLKSVYLSHDTFFSGVGAIFGQECQKRGMLVRVAGDGIMMSPTLIMTPGEVDEVRPVDSQYGHRPLESRVPV